MKLSKNLTENVEKIKNTVNGDDIIYFEFKIGSTNATAIYSECLSDKELLGKLAITPLSSIKNDLNVKDVVKTLNLPEAEKLTDFKAIIDKILLGDAVIFIDTESFAISTACKKPATRPVTEPPTSSILKGPREGFVENIQINLSLIRQRIKSPDLTFTKFTIGKYSQTTVGIIYIKSIANSKIVENLTEKLLNINVDGIIDSSYIIKSISKRKTTMFKEVGTTEKPDILTAKMLEGRIGIMVDGSPIVLTVPFLFVEDFQSAEDYYLNTYRGNFSRVLRLSAIIFAVLLPAFFVSAQLFHLQLIPLSFLLTIVGSIKGIPLSPSVEMFFTLFIFEVLNEASIRMPKYVGIAMSVVGALVLGETAVNAGIVSTPTIMIVALSGICLYTVPDLTETLSVLRLLFLIIAGSMGAYGIILFAYGLIIYLTSIDSFGVPYLAPYAPIIKSDLKDGFLTDFYANMTIRPKSLLTKNKIRKKFND
ncbi:MAG: spore germination protein [Clostridia bacterium]|nr:spore germination protein [Clostridia bacterium]